MEKNQTEVGWLKIIQPLEIKEDLKSIGGYEEIKNTLLEYVKLLDYIEQLKEWNQKIMGKILLHGPPGTGKTTLIKALAKETKKMLVILDVTQVLSKYISESGKNLQKAFEIVKKSHKGSIFFIDEFDSIAKTRESIGDHDEMKRIVNTLLQAFDEINLVDNEILTIAATNFEIILDSAIWRRFDEIIYVPLPDAMQRGQIIKVLTRNIPASIISLNPTSLELINMTENWSGADIQRLINRAIIDKLTSNDPDKIKEETLLKLIVEKKITSTSMRNYKPFYDMREEAMSKPTNYTSKFKKFFESNEG